MTDNEKLELYKRTLESMLMIGHSMQSTDDARRWISVMIDSAWEALNEAGDIEVD